MAKKHKRKCYLCGEELNSPQRYKPDALNGRYVLVCEACADEARFGKFGWDNKRYKVNKDVSYFNGRAVKNR